MEDLTISSSVIASKRLKITVRCVSDSEERNNKTHSFDTGGARLRIEDREANRDEQRILIIRVTSSEAVNAVDNLIRWKNHARISVSIPRIQNRIYGRLSVTTVPAAGSEPCLMVCVLPSVSRYVVVIESTAHPARTSIFEMGCDGSIVSWEGHLLTGGFVSSRWGFGTQENSLACASLKAFPWEPPKLEVWTREGLDWNILIS